jgi:hypothetical protein
MFHEPVRAGLHVGFVLRLGGHAAEADVGAKFIHKARLVTREVIQNGFHAREYSESAAKAKLDCVCFIRPDGQKPSYPGK